MPDTRFDKERMLSLIEAESDRSQLAILLELIQATHDLDDIGRAVKRVGAD